MTEKTLRERNLKPLKILFNCYFSLVERLKVRTAIASQLPPSCSTHYHVRQSRAPIFRNPLWIYKFTQWLSSITTYREHFTLRVGGGLIKFFVYTIPWSACTIFGGPLTPTQRSRWLCGRARRHNIRSSGKRSILVVVVVAKHVQVTSHIMQIKIDIKSVCAQTDW